MERDRRNEAAGRGLQQLELAAVVVAVLMVVLLTLLRLSSTHEINLSVPQKVHIEQTSPWH